MWKFLFSCTLATSLLSAAEKNEEQEPAKKHKAHFVGVRRSAHKASPKKSSSSRKNPWVKTTTYPKKKEKQLPAEEEPLSDDIPYFVPSDTQN